VSPTRIVSARIRQWTRCFVWLGATVTVVVGLGARRVVGGAGGNVEVVGGTVVGTVNIDVATARWAIRCGGAAALHAPTTHNVNATIAGAQER
jgi:aryl-phospho-beta-D-glucosidase BglC (GH1 family)